MTQQKIMVFPNDDRRTSGDPSAPGDRSASRVAPGADAQPAADAAPAADAHPAADGADTGCGRPADGGDLPADDEEVVEDDLVTGGWDAWDVSAPPPRPRQDPLAGFDHERPDRMLARAASLMLVTWRLDRGMRQHEAAEALGVRQAWISRIERERARVSVDLLARIAAVTGSAVTLRIDAPGAGHPVRRAFTSGRAGRAGLQLEVLGPEERSVRPAAHRRTGVGGRPVPEWLSRPIPDPPGLEGAA